MVPGEGSLTADVIKEKFIAKIESFGLSFKKHIVNNTNDSCATMVSVGKKIAPKLMLLCLVHGLQLPIVKKFFKVSKESPLATIEEENEEENSDEEESESEEEEEEDDEDSESEIEDDVDDDEDQEMDESDVESETDDSESNIDDKKDLIKMKKKYNKAVVKCRKIVAKYGGRSNPNRDFFQSKVKAWLDSSWVKESFCFVFQTKLYYILAYIFRLLAPDESSIM